MEVEALLPEQQPQVSRHVAACDVDAHDAVRHGEPLADGHRMRHPVPRVQHHARRPPRRVPGASQTGRSTYSTTTATRVQNSTHHSSKVCVCMCVYIYTVMSKSLRPPSFLRGKSLYYQQTILKSYRSVLQ